MSYASTFMNHFAADLVTNTACDARDEQAFSAEWNRAKKNPIPFKYVDDEFKQLLERGWTLLCYGIFAALPGYWILGDDFMIAVGIFYTSQPGLILSLLRQIFDMEFNDGRFDGYDFTELAHYGIATVGYAYACTALCFWKTILVIALGLFSGSIHWFWFLTFWTAVSYYRGLPIGSVPRAWRAFKKVDEVASIPRDFLRAYFWWMIFKMVIYPRIGLNWLLYRYYRWGKTERPTAMLEDHVFKPLDRSKREIRLLKIPRLFLGEYKQYGGMRDFRPGNCELHRLSLDDKNLQPYECISYHWGNGEKEWDVQIDGQCMEVSEVVYTILCERRSLVKDRWIWIDQICIDQADQREKKTQLPLMTEIYSRASRVVVHLSSAEDYGDYKKSASVRAIIRKLGTFPEMVDPEFRGLAMRAWLTDHDNLPGWQAFLELMAHPFFSRIWVVQEIAAARSLNVLIGDNYISWALLVSAIRNVSGSEMIKTSARYGVYNRSALDSGQHFRRMCGLRNQMMEEDHPPFRLAELLSRFHDFDASNKLDKVYALIGISDAAAFSGLLVDYGTDEITLACRTAQFLVVRRQYLEVMHAAGIGWAPTRHGLPSWVPDWSLQPRGPSQFRFKDSLEQRPFMAGGDGEPKISCTADGRICHAFGATLGCVEKLSVSLDIPEEEFDSSLFTDKIFVRITEWLARARNFVEDHYPDVEHRDTTFWYTLVAGRNDSHEILTRDSSFLAKVRAWEIQMRDLPGFQRLVDKGMNGADEAINAFKGIIDFKAVIAAIGGAGLSKGARLAIIDGCYLGLVPLGTQEGDIACIFAGAETPVLLRRRESNVGFELVGTCYIQGTMLGECAWLLDDAFGEVFELH